MGRVTQYQHSGVPRDVYVVNQLADSLTQQTITMSVVCLTQVLLYFDSHQSLPLLSWSVFQ